MQRGLISVNTFIGESESGIECQFKSVFMSKVVSVFMFVD